MCIVVDACTFAKVFDPHNKEHDKFSDVLKWLIKKKGKLIIGGTKYQKEVLDRRSALNILSELDRMNRIVRLDDKKVDARAKKLKELEPSAKFDDEHIVAMVGVARCRVVCTDDKPAMEYLKRKDLYPDDLKPPSIYSNGNTRLCCNANIVGACCD